MIKLVFGGALCLALLAPCHAANPSLQQALSRAQAGDAGAQYTAGMMYLMGQGTQQDFVQARRWIGASAKAGLPQAMVALANLTDVGLGGPQDTEHAKELRQQAAKAGDPTARGQLEEERKFPGQAEFRRAATLVNLRQVQPALAHAQRAADLGNPNGLFLMGWFHHGGNGVPVNLAAARAFYLKAAERGHSEAARGYAFMHEFGQGGPVDRKTALMYYDKSAAAGNALAKRNAANLRSPDYDAKPAAGGGGYRRGQVPCMTPGARIDYVNGGCNL